MKHCYKWMVLCVAVALAIFVILPMFGIAIAGASLLVPILMIGCCIIPMVMMMRASGSEGGKGGCCGGHEKTKEPATSEKEQKPASTKQSCH